MISRVSKILIIFTLLIISCKNKEEEATPMWNASNSEIAKWKEEALTKGDTNAYYNLSKDYMDSSYNDFLKICEFVAVISLIPLELCPEAIYFYQKF